MIGFLAQKLQFETAIYYIYMVANSTKKQLLLKLYILGFYVWVKKDVNQLKVEHDQCRNSNFFLSSNWYLLHFAFSFLYLDSSNLSVILTKHNGVEKRKKKTLLTRKNLIIIGNKPWTTKTLKVSVLTQCWSNNLVYSVNNPGKCQTLSKPYLQTQSFCLSFIYPQRNIILSHKQTK